MQSYVNGLGLGASLIMAIGAQNAHVLRMGIRRQHVVLTVIACVIIDIVLISLGVAGAGAVIQNSPTLLIIARWGGAAFLLWYGLRSWRSVLTPKSLNLGAEAAAPDAHQALTTVVALSLLNPHVYLDTVVLLGSVGGSYPESQQRMGFSFGAMTASVLWFTALGFGAAQLSGVFQRPMVWKGIEALTGATMIALAASLVLRA
ncbi:LysE/ArgO family amino acid transporter [Pseudoduganella sp. RAF53_2]|uniref:LysE/ArgO family amino acid transporter n=1 Tax=unclassified Pseudoduganella TaxID=2637179 RepID=UPI003F94FCEB